MKRQKIAKSNDDDSIKRTANLFWEARKLASSFYCKQSITRCFGPVL